MELVGARRRAREVCKESACGGLTLGEATCLELVSMSISPCMHSDLPSAVLMWTPWLLDELWRARCRGEG